MTSAGRRLKWYERGATTVFACRYDARFSYCLYVPASFEAGSTDHALVVAVHGSSRTATEFRDSFAAFAEAHRCVVLAPLFPVGIMGDDNGDGRPTSGRCSSGATARNPRRRAAGAAS